MRSALNPSGAQMSDSPIPLIDLQKFSSASELERARVIAEVRKALEEIGFLLITGHGVEQSLIDRVTDASLTFFDRAETEQMRALLAGDNEALGVIAKDLAWAREPIGEITGDPELFATYNIQMEKIRIQAAGYCKAGPIRPPYNIMPDHYAECARENARRWRQLCEKYAKVSAAVRN